MNTFIVNHQTSIRKHQSIGYWNLIIGYFKQNLYLIIGICLLFITSVSPARAETLTSPNYKVRLGNFNMTSGMKDSTSYNLTDTVGQIAADFFSSSGYHVKAGFQYIYTLYDFSFAISSLALDLGTLTSNTFSTATNTLTITSPGQGYSVSALESNKLTNIAGNTIPDTTCDSGTCTETSAGVWSTATNNGFGYNVNGSDVSADFIGVTYFRPFPDLSLAESASTIMSSSISGKNRTATVTYKVSPPGSQASGIYTTQIIYIATPVY